MPRCRVPFVVMMLFLAFCGPVFGDEKPPVAYRGAKILTATGRTFDPGTLVIENGKIAGVGPADEIDIPEGAAVHEVEGKVIIPGLVDTHSHVGVFTRPIVPAHGDGNELTGPVQSGLRALDSLNPFDPGIRMAHAGGVTTANIMPGSGNVIGGQTLYVKLRGRTPEEMQIESPHVSGGLKMANGENPKRVYGAKGQAPGTRMKVASLQRSEFVRAKNYQDQWERYRKQLAAGEDVSPPEVDLALEPLVEVLQRKRTVHFHSHRADDILTALRLKQEFGFDLVVQHGTEAYKVLDEIARHDVPVSMTLLDSPGGKPEIVEFIEEAGAKLVEAGIKLLINTDDPITESRFFLRTAAIAVRGGLSEEAALRAITLHPAEVMRLDDRVGSLEAGKDADFVLLSGEPFSTYTRVLETWIDGEKLFDFDNEKQRAYQTGGFGVAEDEQVPEPKPPAEPPEATEVPDIPQDAPEADEDATELVVLAGRLHTVAEEAISDGAVHVRDGKIEFAGRRGDLELPEEVPVISAAVVTPGLIDAHSVIPLAGLYNVPADQDSDEQSEPNQADIRVLDAFNPAEPLLRFLLEEGVTVIHACPGRDNAIAGLTGVFRTHGRTAEAMTVRFPQAMLFNLGHRPKAAYPDRRPGTRMGTAALIRTALTDAAHYARKRQEAEEDADTPPPRDLKQEALGRVLDRKVPAMFCAQRADDCLTALRMVEEFNLQGVLALGAEAWLIPERIAQADVPVITHPTMQRIGDTETYNSFLGNAATLLDANVRVAVGSGVEGYVPRTRVIRHEAAMAMVYGLGVERALRAITLDAARILGIDDRFGSLEAGKTADLVLYDGDPFEHATRVTHVVLDGRLVHDRANRSPIPLAQRWLMSSPEAPCCLGW